MPKTTPKITVLDPSKLSDGTKEELLHFINVIEVAGFEAKQEFHGHHLLAEAAVNQLFTNRPRRPDNSSATQQIDLEDMVDDASDDSDFAYSLYLPFSRVQMEGWMGHITEAIIPADKKFYRISVDYMDTLSAVSPQLVSILEDCWNEFTEKAFHITRTVTKFMKATMQSITFGCNSLYGDYDPDKQLVNYQVLNMKRVAIFPIKEDITKCNHIYRYHLFMPDLRNDPTINKDIVEKIEGEMGVQHEAASYLSQTVESQRTSSRIPYGYVAAVTLFIPYFKVPDTEEAKGEVFENVLVTVLRKQHLISTDDKGSNDGQIIKMIQFENRDQNPFVFSTFGPTLPNTVYYQSKIYQNLPFQAMGNLTTAVAMQGLVTSLFPILKQKDYGDETSDNFEYMPRAIWSVRDMDDVQVMELPYKLSEYIEMMKFIYSLIQQSSGITDVLEGSKSNTSERKTKFETKTQYDSGSTRINTTIKWQEEEFLQPAVLTYLNLTQFHIKHQVESAKALLGTKGKAISRWNKIIDESPLFKRFLTLSKIREKIMNLVKDLMLTDPMQAKRIQSYMDTEAIYDMITIPFDTSNILIEGNSAEVRKQEKLEALTGVIESLQAMQAEEKTGKVFNIEDIITVFKKLTSAPDIEFLIKPLPPPMMPGMMPPEEGMTPPEAAPTEPAPTEAAPPEGI